jgi:hypothetical protein
MKCGVNVEGGEIGKDQPASFMAVLVMVPQKAWGHLHLPYSFTIGGLIESMSIYQRHVYNCRNVRVIELLWS